jgi:hypothetical protein
LNKRGLRLFQIFSKKPGGVTVKDSLFALLALLSALAAAFFFYSFQKQSADAGSMNLILSIIFILLAIAFGAYYMFNRVNRHDEIHVTE